MIRPDWQCVFVEASIAGGSAKEKYVLLGRANMIPYGFWEQFSQPRAAGKDVLVGRKIRSIGESQLVPLATVETSRCDRSLPVLSAFLEKSVQHRLAGYACRKKSSFGFVDSPMN